MSIISGHLAIIRSQDEEDMYFKAMEKQKCERAWIGLHDQFKEDQYTTVLDEDMGDIGYKVNWAIVEGYQQPDNGGGPGTPQQDCISLVRDNVSRGMDDSRCDETFPHICEL